MTKHLVFVTPGLIDLRSFNTFGFNAKPNTENPIGFFGTGLKISVAVIARLGCKMTVLIDGVEHEFYTSKTEFRGKEFDAIQMRKRKGLMSRWNYTKMPYTTELGKNWEPWQVYRELESNTRDEGGHTEIVDDEDPHGMSFLNDDHKGKTVIIVDEPSIVAVHEQRDKIFLPKEELELIAESGRLEIYDAPSSHIYYRGMRVLDLDKESGLTYNITCEQRLTEDRTLYSWNALWEIRNFFTVVCEDTDLLRRVLKLDESKWESNIEFDNTFTTMGDVFRKTTDRMVAAGEVILPRVITLRERYVRAESTEPETSVTMKDSEWQALRKILGEYDSVEMSVRLGWAEDDPRLKVVDKLIGLIPDDVEDEIEF